MGRLRLGPWSEKAVLADARTDSDRDGAPVRAQRHRGPRGAAPAIAASERVRPEDVDAVAGEPVSPGPTSTLPRPSTPTSAEPRGRRHVRVCAGTACFAASGGEHLGAAAKALGAAVGEASDDGSVSLQPVYCLGYCYGGPAALDGERPCAGPDLVDQLSGAVARRDPEVPIAVDGRRAGRPRGARRRRARRRGRRGNASAATRPRRRSAAR